MVLSLLGAACALGVTLDTGDGLLTFQEADGGISGGAGAPLIAGQWGGLIQPGRPITPSNLAHLDFDSSRGPRTTAPNSNWNNAGSYAAWQANGGIGDTGHLLLDDGSTAGAGMALVNTLPVIGSHTLASRPRHDYDVVPFDQVGDALPTLN